MQSIARAVPSKDFSIALDQSDKMLNEQQALHVVRLGGIDDVLEVCSCVDRTGSRWKGSHAGTFA